MFLRYLPFGTCNGVWLFMTMRCSAAVSVVCSGNETLVHRKGLGKTLQPFLHTHTKFPPGKGGAAILYLILNYSDSCCRESLLVTKYIDQFLQY